MKQAVFIICTFLWPVAMLAQNVTKFTKDGKVEAIALDKDNRVVPDAAALKKMNDEERKKVRKVLQEKIDETITAMTEGGIGSEYYYLAWGEDTAHIRAELAVLKSALDKQTRSEFDAAVAHKVSHVERSAKAIANSVYGVDAFTLDTSKERKAALTQTDIFNVFLVDLFNATIGEFKEGRDFSPKQHAHTSEVLASHRKSIDSMLHLYRDAMASGVAADMYCTMAARKTELLRVRETNQAIQMLGSDWFRQWFWIRGGTFKLNPLDFTTEEYLRNTPSHDLDRAGIFNRYVDSLTERYIRYDSTQRVDEFKALLAHKKVGKEAFGFAARTDALVAANQTKMNELLTARKDINVIEVPAGKYAQFSADPDIEFENDEKDMKKSLRTDDRKTVVIHNIPASWKAGLLETNKDIADRSATQQFFDSVASFGGQVMKIVANLTPYGGVLAAFDPPAITHLNEIVPRNTGGPLVYNPFKGNALPTSYDDTSVFISKLITQLGDGCAYDKELFDTLFRHVSDVSTYAFNVFLYEDTFAKLQLKKLIYDSLHAELLLDMYANSTPPPTNKLEVKKAPGSQYQSKVLHTKTSDNAIEKTVTPYVIKAKDDTAWMDKFSYKVGRNHHFQLSAGIAYTMQHYSQAVATTANGQVSITHDVRQYRFVAGVNMYPGKGLYLLDNRFLGRFGERYSIFAGVGVPDPLGNVYLGLSYDLVPGFRLTVGPHITRQDKYAIQNNVITEKRLSYKLAGTFLAVQIDPTSLINTLTAFNK